MMRVFVVSIALALAALPVSVARAQTPAADDARVTPAPWPEFTFKRIKPPAAGTNERITVQIDPQDPPARVRLVTRDPEPEIAATPPGRRAPAGPSSRHAWFWDRVSPSLAEAGPARFYTALDEIGDGRVGAPRLATLAGIARAHGKEILGATVGTGVSPAFVLAVIATESAGRTDAVSHAGAMGLMQLMPATAERFGVRDRNNPGENIAGGVAYLDWLMQEFGRDPILALAGYNAGEGAVRSHGGVPPYPETRDYVPKVLAAWKVARALCVTPPELVSDGCVFSLPSS